MQFPHIFRNKIIILFLGLTIFLGIFSIFSLGHFAQKHLTSQVVTAPPVSSLAVNGGQDIEVLKNTQATYTWNSDFANQYSGVYTRVAGPANRCGNTGAMPFNSSAGSFSNILKSSQVGCKYKIDYIVKNSATSFSSSSTVYITVVDQLSSGTTNTTITSSIETSNLSPVTSSLKVNDLSEIEIVKGTTVTYKWSSSNANQFSGTWVRVAGPNSCGTSGASSFNSASGTISETIIKNPGCSYKLTFYATNSSTGQKSESSVKVTIVQSLNTTTNTTSGTTTTNTNTSTSTTTSGTTTTNTNTSTSTTTPSINIYEQPLNYIMTTPFSIKWHTVGTVQRVKIEKYYPLIGVTSVLKDNISNTGSFSLPPITDNYCLAVATPYFCWTSTRFLEYVIRIYDADTQQLLGETQPIEAFHRFGTLVSPSLTTTQNVVKRGDSIKVSWNKNINVNNDTIISIVIVREDFSFPKLLPEFNPREIHPLYPGLKGPSIFYEYPFGNPELLSYVGYGRLDVPFSQGSATVTVPSYAPEGRYRLRLLPNNSTSPYTPYYASSDTNTTSVFEVVRKNTGVPSLKIIQQPEGGTYVFGTPSARNFHFRLKAENIDGNYLIVSQRRGVAGTAHAENGDLDLYYDFKFSGQTLPEDYKWEIYPFNYPELKVTSESYTIVPPQ